MHGYNVKLMQALEKIFSEFLINCLKYSNFWILWEIRKDSKIPDKSQKWWEKY